MYKYESTYIAYSRFYTSFMIVVDSRTISATKALPDIVFGVYFGCLVWCLPHVCVWQAKTKRQAARTVNS